MDQTQTLQYEPVQSAQISTEAFPIDLLLQRNTMTLALSDYSMMHYSLEHLKPIWTIKGAHKKKIAQLCTVDEKLVCSASSDATLKLFDVTAGKEIQTLRNLGQDDFYSVAASQHILAGGSEGYIRFFDLRTMKLRSTFNESQSDEITGLQFNPGLPTELLASSLDGLLVVYDLTKENEEESLSNMNRFSEPIDRCAYINQDVCFAVSTTFSITVINNTLGEKVKEVKTVTHDEFNEDYFADIVQYKGNLSYFLGSKSDPQWIRQFSLDKHHQNQLLTAQQEQIRHIRYLDAHDTFLLLGEDGLLEVLQPKGVYTQSIEQEATSIVQESPLQIKKFRKQ